MRHRTLFRRWRNAGLMALGLTLLWAASASAHVSWDPVKVRLAGTPATVESWQRYEGVFEIEAAVDVTIESVAFEGEGWLQGRLETSATLNLVKSTRSTVPFSAVPTVNAGRIGIRYEIDGRSYVATLDPVAWRDVHTKGTMARLAPMDKSGAPSDLRWPAKRFPGPGDADRPDDFRDDDDTTGQTGDKADWDIRVTAQIAYVRDDGVIDYPHGAPFTIYDEDSTWDEELKTGTLGPEGEIDVTFHWDSGYFGDTHPDLYIEVMAADERLQVQTSGSESNYGWDTWVEDDFNAYHWDLGLVGIEGNRPAAHIFKIIKRALNKYSWEGYGLDDVDVQWPDDSTQYSSYWEEIHIAEEKEWNEGSYLHELGHHWQHQYTYTLDPQYCDYQWSICPGDDDPPCAHCMWCEEHDETAHLEGFANYLSYLLGDHFRTEMDPPPHHWRREETVADCSTFATPCDCDPFRTEGHIMAWLGDLDDYFVDNDSTYTTVWFDDINLNGWALVQIADLDRPHTVWDWWDLLPGYFPDDVEKMWEAGMNCGFNFDQEPPGEPIGLTSTTHDVGVPSPDATIHFTWDRAFDGASGIDGYAFAISQDTPVGPGTEVQIEDIRNFTTDPLSPGNWYFTLRAIDRAGWVGMTYATAGPYVIREPNPSDLIFKVPPGWVQELVPHPLPNYEPGGPPQPEWLEGWTGATWWSYAGENNGEAAISEPFYNRLFVDGVQHDESSLGGASPGMDFSFENVGLTYIKGGLHTFECILDHTEIVPETNEANNGTAYQYVWSPMSMAPGEDIRQVTPPNPYGGMDNLDVYEGYNCDGFRFHGGGWWNAVVMYIDEDDVSYNLHLFQPSTGPDNGFTGLGEAFSARPHGCTQAVLVNQNTAGEQDWDVGVVAEVPIGESFYNLRHVESELVAVGSSDYFSWYSGDFLKLYEFGVAVPEQSVVSLVLTTNDYDSPIHLAFLNHDFVVGDLLDATLTTVTDETGKARLDLQLYTAGYYGVVIYRDHKDGTDEVTGLLEIMLTPPDLEPALASGWHAPLVPRPDSAFDPYLMAAPDTLPGDTWDDDLEGTWYNLSAHNIGPANAFEIVTQIYLDGQEHWLFWWGSLPDATPDLLHIPERFDVTGGRHTLAFVLDDFDEILEISEENNTFAEQWVWRPKPIHWWEPPSTRAAPPDRMGGWADLPDTASYFFNCDGVHLPAAGMYDTTSWYGVASMPGDTSNVDLRLHEVGYGARDGFGDKLANSGWGPSQLDYILINHDLTPKRPFDVGVIGWKGEQVYSIRAARAEIWDDPLGSHGPFVMGDTEYFHMYEFVLPPDTYDIALTSETGFVQWGIALHDGAENSVQNRFETLPNAVSWFNDAGEDEEFTVTVDGGVKYCLTVWKTDADCMLEIGTYTVTIGPSPTGVEQTPTIARSGIASIYPNPFNPSTSIVYELQTAGRVRLDIFDARGRRVRNLVSGPEPAGRHEVVWQGRDAAGGLVSSGIYFVRFVSDDLSETRKIMLLQ